MAMAVCPASASRNSSHSGVRAERRPVEELQHALDRAFGDQRHGEVGDEPLLGDQAGADERLLGEVADANEAPIECRLPGMALAKPQTQACRAGPPEALPSGILQRLRLWPEEQDLGGSNAQLGENLVEEDVQGHAQIKAAGDRHIDSP